MPTPNDPALAVETLTLGFGGVAALDGVSLSVPAGRITGLIGPNGAGKTTLFNAVSGLATAKTGTVHLFGRNVTGFSPARLNQAGLVRTFQLARGLPSMTVFEHLMLYGPKQQGERIMQAFRLAWHDEEAALADRAVIVARRLGLARVIDNQVGALSGGQRKLLEIGRAIMAQPRLMLLDEPAAGVNPTLAETIGDHLIEIAAEGTTILLIEHDMALVARVCAQIIVMAAGRQLAEGSFAEISENPTVQDAYLGARA